MCADLQSFAMPIRKENHMQKISYIYKNYAKVGNVEKRSDKEMPDEEFEASNIDIGVSIYANEEDASKVLLYTTKVFELDRVE